METVIVYGADFRDIDEESTVPACGSELTIDTAATVTVLLLYYIS